MITRATGDPRSGDSGGQQRREGNELVEPLDRPTVARFRRLSDRRNLAGLVNAHDPTLSRNLVRDAIGARQHRIELRAQVTKPHVCTSTSSPLARTRPIIQPTGTSNRSPARANKRLGTSNFAAVATSSAARLLPLDSKEQPVRRLATSAFVPEPHSGLASSGCVRSALRRDGEAERPPCSFVAFCAREVL